MTSLKAGSTWLLAALQTRKTNLFSFSNSPLKMSGLFLLPHPSPLACFFGIIIDMHLELITVLGKKVDQEVYEVILPTAEGEIAVYPGHEPLVSVAVPGAIAVRNKKTDDDSKLDYYAISGGVIEVSQTYVRVLVDEAIEDNEIVEAETKAALDRAIAMRDNAKSQLELEKAHELVDRHTVRLKVAGLRRRHRR
jgi:F-type H+-transporting ATPase subunit epsilon